MYGIAHIIPHRISAICDAEQNGRDQRDPNDNYWVAGGDLPPNQGFRVSMRHFESQTNDFLYCVVPKCPPLYATYGRRFCNYRHVNTGHILRTRNDYSLCTYPVSEALHVVVVGRALGLVDVRIDADARLVHAHQIVAARRAVAHQTVTGEGGRQVGAAG